MSEPMHLAVGDVVQMRKQHPCGGDTWRIVRIGADIGIRCLTCDRKVLLPRAECERRIKRVLSRATDDAGVQQSPLLHSSDTATSSS